MRKNFLFSFLCLISLFLLFLQLNCSSNKMTKEEQIARGKYLVNIGGCNDCHSPKVMTPMGPIPDSTRLLSGHPSDQPLAEVDPAVAAPGKWVLTDDGTTTWVGPWGISYTANLTPDSSTGLGLWTADTFIKTMRTGKHMGSGRMLLPPMPWQGIGQLTDEDLQAIFAYLQTLKPISNRVPAPVPPNMLSDKSMNN